MYDIVSTLIIPTNEFGIRLLSFLELTKNGASNDVIKNKAFEVDSSLDSLLHSFPKDIFWSSISGLKNIEVYPEDDGTTFYELKFDAIEGSFAKDFAAQFETWMNAIGCIDVSSELRPRYSQSTVGNVLNVTTEYNNGTLALFLGAGVSKQIDLPLWKELLERMVEDWIFKRNGDPGVADRLRLRNLDEQARWLKQVLGTEYRESVRQALYHDVYRQGISSSDILETILKMKKLRAICTYNYDDILESHKDSCFRAVASARGKYSLGEIPVYHVHGLLPYIGTPQGEIILSEDDYHSLANNPFHWANIVQVHLLRECTCLLIGISGTDPNLRRILDLVGDNKAGETYIIQKMDDIDNTDPDTLKAWSNSKEFDRSMFADIHLSTIWIHRYEEIPSILKTFIGETRERKKRVK